VGEAIDVARREDEAGAQLEGMGAEFMLAMAGGAGAFAALEVVRASEVREIGDAQCGDFVGLAALVD